MIALISSYNEGDVIARVIEHLVENGVNVYLLDNRSTDDTVEQASRCLTCHVQTIYDGSLCIGCGRCTDACPYGCLSLVPSTDVDASGLAAAAVAAGGPSVAGSVWMLKDEDLCVRCGLCAERCPTGAMTMERYDLRAGAGVE